MKQSNALKHVSFKRDLPLFKIMKVTTFLSFVCVFSLFAENTFAGEKAAMKGFVVSGNGERENAEKAYNLVQEITVKGTVLDEQRVPLIGVNVMIEGSTQGTITDVDGNFTIKVKPDASLRFSYIGYESITVKVNNQESIEVVMKESASALDEVVVVGYGIQKKINLTGSVSQVSSKDLMKAPMQNTSNLLTGKISGLTSIQSSGKPGDDGTALYVRGLQSFGGNGPMVLVDGVARSMDYVNPNDIESISVLKDASAAIYGVQGANGVILITTKGGSESPAKIMYDGSFTLTENTAMPEFLNAPDYMYWHNKARSMDGLDPLWTADIQNKVMSNDPNSIWGQTDWLEKVFQTGSTNQHNVSASGGTDKVKYFASLGVMDQEGTLKNTSFNRYNVRANLDIKVAKNLKFTTNISGYRTDRNWPGSAIGGQQEFDPIRQAINSIPIIKSEYNGIPTAWQGSSYLVNGYAALYNSGYKKQNRWRLESNYKLEYDFSDITDYLKGLKASLFASYDYGHTADSNFDGYYELYGVNSSFDEWVAGASGYNKARGYSKASSWGDTYMLRPQLEYSRLFGKHNVSAIALYEKTKNYSNTMTGTKRGYVIDNPVDIEHGGEFPEAAISGSHGYTGYQSWVGRLNYVYDNKYLLEFAFRNDASYKFPTENRWGFFPSVSAGWVISQEEFFQKALPNVDLLKLRGSYGVAGNDATVEPFLDKPTYKLAGNSMILGGRPISQFYTKNPYLYSDLTWYTTKTFNVGVDVEMWRGMLGLEVDVFYQLTENILEEQSGSYPTSLGSYYPSFRNTGKVDNRGIELTVKHNNRINSDWSYGLRGNVSFARNRVLSKAVSDNYPNYRGVLGESMGARYGYKALGLFQTQEQLDVYPVAPSGEKRLGDIMYLDYNGDGVINADHDYVKIGYGQIPEINFSLNLDVSYKDFYASMLWQGVSHVDYELSGVYDTGVTSSTSYTSVFSGSGNTPSYLAEDSWTPENTGAKYPRLSTISNGNNAWRSSWWVVNGEYLRLKNAQIGYNLPAKLLKKTPFSRINIYMAGTNLLTFSHFKYVDPESPSVSNGHYPQQKTYSMGLNVTF